MPELAYVNGTFCELHEAKVSVEDRGFQFADGVYEVLVAYDGKPFRLAEHLERLSISLESIDLSFDLKQHRIEETIIEGIARSRFDTSMVYLQITRGAAPRSLACPEGVSPTVVMTFKPKPVVDPDLRSRGLSVVTVPELRWSRCHVKSIALLPNSIIKNDAVRRGYDDAIFVDGANTVREATAANVFAVIDGMLTTPPSNTSILLGVTRGYILDCASMLGLQFQERDVTLEELARADEVMLSSTTIDVLSVTRLDDQPVADGRPGPVAGQLYEKMNTAAAGGVEQATG